VDLILRRARLPDGRGPLDIAVAGGRIARLATRVAPGAATEIDAAGRLVIPGLVESHFHLDKALLGAGAPAHADSVAGAIRATAEAKRRFSVADIADRARRALEMAIRHGVTAMRTHVEVDPIVGLRGMEAILPLQKTFAWAVDLQICVFPQEGILQTPGTERLMRQALRMGGEAVGGVPYNDPDPRAHLALVFDLAREFDRDVDLHLDFFDEPGPQPLLIGEVADLTLERGWEGRVVAGHVSALGALEAEAAAPLIARVRDAGVSIVTLPATDLYLLGRGDRRNPRRGLPPVRQLLDAGVNVAVATNNLQNPFTPFGDADLLRVANLLATAAHLGTAEDLVRVLGMATEAGARALRLPDYGIREGALADLVLLDCTEPAEAVAAIPERLVVVKGGRVSVTTRVESTLARPG
jgi:cytosine deaminase